MLSASGVGRVRVAPLSYTPSQPAILSSADSLSSSGDAGSVFTLDRKKRKMHGGRPALNPLRMFPSKSDTLVAGLFHSTGGAYDAHRSAGGDRGGLLLLSATQGSDRDRGTEQQQQPPVQWLHPEIIDANFGIEGTDPDSLLRKSYRRIVSSQVFSTPKREDINLKDLYDPPMGTSKAFLLVEQSQLGELALLESALRAEKESIGEQCLSLLAEESISARVPTPAMRLAVHNICEARMREAAASFELLEKNWSEYSAKNGFNRPHVYLKDSFMKNTPLADRALKLRLVQEAANDWRVRCDRDTMAYEDSRAQVLRCFDDAFCRRLDYDRYYVLAIQFGLMSANEFSLDNSPGSRYFNRVNRAARMLQRRWGLYWPIRKLRMHRAARYMQTLFRSYKAFHKWNPVIKVRAKYRKKIYYRFCMQRWLSYNRLCCEIRESIRYFLQNSISTCFSSWKRYWEDIKKGQKQKIEKMENWRKSHKVWLVFTKWHSFHVHSKSVLQVARRVLHAPHFDAWIRYTRDRKLLRKKHSAAIRVQTTYRLYLGRRKAICRRNARNKVCRFLLIPLSKMRVKKIRDITLRAEFEKWFPDEVKMRFQRSIEKERRRLITCQQTVHEKENAIIADIRRHLKSKSGRTQLEQMIRFYHPKVRQGLPGHTGCFGFCQSRSDLKNKIKDDLLEEGSKLIRIMAVHDFNAKSPPPFKCAVAGCNTYFVSEDQYRSHIINPSAHDAYDSNFVAFHVLLKSSKALEQLRRYLCNKFGFNSVVNTLDLWTNIQEWRKVTIKTEAYVTKACMFYEAFLRPGCPRPVDMKFTASRDLESRMEDVINREFEGFYRITQSQGSFFERLFRGEGKTFEEWTTDNIIPANLFDDLEFQCFLRLFQLYRDSDFQTSPEGMLLTQIIENDSNNAALKDFDDFKTTRFDAIRKWTKEFMAKEAAISALAADASYVILDAMVEAIGEETSQIATAEESKRRMYIEQSEHETTCFFADDVMFWVLENTVADILENFTMDLVNHMLSKLGTRRILNEFVGRAKPKKKIDWSKRDPSKQDWFSDFSASYLLQDGKRFSNERESSAAIIIQSLWRRRSAMKTCRKAFVATYAKRFDKTSKLYYYINLKTGDSSWERPSMTKYVFPKSNW